MPRVYVYLLAVLVLIGILPLPYGYYVFLRITVFIFSCYMIYFLFSQEKIPMMVAFIIIAIVFNPIIQIFLSKELWVVIDILVAIFLCVIGKKAGAKNI